MEKTTSQIRTAQKRKTKNGVTMNIIYIYKYIKDVCENKRQLKLERHKIQNKKWCYNEYYIHIYITGVCEKNDKSN